MRFHDLQISRKPNPRSTLIELDCFCDIYEDIAGGMFRRHADKGSNKVRLRPLFGRDGGIWLYFVQDYYGIDSVKVSI